MPENPEIPKDASIEARRNFFRQAAGGAASAATGSTVPEAHLVTEAQKAQMLDKCKDAYANLRFRFDANTFLKYPLPITSQLNLDGSLNTQLVDSLPTLSSNKRETRSESLQTLRDFLKMIGPEGMVYTHKHDVFGSGARNEQGLLDPAKLQKMFTERDKETMELLNALDQNLPAVTAKAKKVLSTAQAFTQRIKARHPNLNPYDAALTLEANLRESQGLTKYVENPGSDLEKELDKLVESQQRKPNPDVAQTLQHCFGQPVEIRDDQFYITVPSLSTSEALYQTLRNLIASKRSGDFPSRDECCVVRLEDKGQKSWVTRYVRVPANGYGLKLSEEMADSLAEVIKGSQGDRIRHGDS